MSTTTRRQFLQDVTVGGAAALAASRLQPLAARQAAGALPWRSRIGLEVYTVRDLLMKDYEGTLAKVAAIGYTEVEPTSYNNMSPKDFRAMLDRHKLTMPSTHSAARGEGADLERKLEGFQVMGIKYTEIQVGGARGGGGGAGAPGAARGAAPAGARGAAGPVAGRPANLPPGAYYDAGTGIVHNAFKETEAFGPYQPPGVARLGQASRGAAQRQRQDRAEVRHEDARAQPHGRVREADRQSAHDLRHPPRGNRSGARHDADRPRLDLHRRRRSDRVVQGAPGPIRAVARQGRVRLEEGESVARARTRGSAAWRSCPSAAGIST